MAIGCSFIGGLVVIILMIIDRYFISEYWCLLIAIGGYSINDY